MAEENFQKEEARELDSTILDIKPVKDTEEKDLEFLDVLKWFSPGTPIRTALDDILRANMGALIVFDNENLKEIMDGGFRVNTRFTPQKLIELAKMDGAIILSKDMKKILFANTLLVPSLQTSTKETGTRHKAAERTAKQIKTVVIAISERRNKITLFYKGMRYELDSSSEILRRATESLQILEKQKEVLNDLINNLNVLELTVSVNISDVCNVLQRGEAVKRISSMIKRYLIELGKEGTIVSMRLKELTRNLNKELDAVLVDYFEEDFEKIKETLEKINFDFLLETQNISRILFEETEDKSISPKGKRILEKTSLFEREIEQLIGSFDNLENILNADDEELLKVLENNKNVELFKKEIDMLKEKIMMGKSF